MFINCSSGYSKSFKSVAEKDEYSVITTSVNANLVYSVRYSVVPVNFSLLTVTLYLSLRTTLVYDIKYSVSCRFHRFDYKCRNLQCCCLVCSRMRVGKTLITHVLTQDGPLLSPGRSGLVGCRSVRPGVVSNEGEWLKDSL